MELRDLLGRFMGVCNGLSAGNLPHHNSTTSLKVALAVRFSPPWLPFWTKDLRRLPVLLHHGELRRQYGWSLVVLENCTKSWTNVEINHGRLPKPTCKIEQWRNLTPSKQRLNIALFRLTHLIRRPFSWDFDQRARCLSSASLNLKVPGVAQSDYGIQARMKSVQIDFKIKPKYTYILYHPTYSTNHCKPHYWSCSLA